MSHELKLKTKRNILLWGLVIIFIALQGLNIVLENLKLSMFNGVLTAFQYGVCLSIVITNKTKGLKAAVILEGITILSLLMSIFKRGNTAALPGLFNAIFYIITLILIAKFYRDRENESVTDLLTGLMNRRGLYKHLKERIQNEDSFGIIYISIENFKYINDTYGHAYGDELMRRIAQRIRNILKDSGEFARLTGTDFVISLNQGMDAESTANKVLSALNEKFLLYVDENEVDCYITSYAGVANYPHAAKNYEALIKCADIAMFEAMNSKNKQALVFDQYMADSMNKQVEIEKLIKESLEKDYFYMVYQPQYHLDGKVLRGFEALLRLKTPEGIMVSPGEFIPVAEKSDLILQIDDYVLRRAMREFKLVVECRKDIVLSINVSAKNIADSIFVDKLSSIIREESFPTNNLEIEITEYCMVDSMEITIQNINAMKNMGIQIALDDFGTGYTSLNYVAKLPINLIKIDKSLVDEIVNSSKNREFVNTVISMGHLMGCEVLAEGVEDESQLQCLKENGCDMVQGFVWNKPLSYDEAKNL